MRLLGSTSRLKPCPDWVELYHEPEMPWVIANDAVRALTVTVPTIPMLWCISQWKPNVPGVLKVTVALHAAPLTSPLPPAPSPSQPFAQRNSPGVSDVTLWV